MPPPSFPPPTGESPAEPFKFQMLGPHPHPQESKILSVSPRITDFKAPQVTGVCKPRLRAASGNFTIEDLKYKPTEVNSLCHKLLPKGQHFPCRC